jgi:hypothetical protein
MNQEPRTKNQEPRTKRLNKNFTTFTSTLFASLIGLSLGNSESFGRGTTKTNFNLGTIKDVHNSKAFFTIHGIWTMDASCNGSLLSDGDPIKTLNQANNTNSFFKESVLIIGMTGIYTQCNGSYRKMECTYHQSAHNTSCKFSKADKYL